MPYQSTWNNPYLPVNGTQSALGQSAIPAMQSQLATGWTQYQQPVNGVVKVNGRDSALQYQLPPNSMSPALFDNNGKTFYIVSTDGTGMKTVEAYDFTPHVEQQPVQIDGAEFVSRKEFDEFTAKVNAAIGAINAQPVHEPVPAAQHHEPADGFLTLNPTGGHLGDGPAARAE